MTRKRAWMTSTLIVGLLVAVVLLLGAQFGEFGFAGHEAAAILPTGALV